MIKNLPERMAPLFNFIRHKNLRHNFVIYISVSQPPERIPVPGLGGLLTFA
jgi:hypothetical protein